MTPESIGEFFMCALGITGSWIHLKTKVDDHLEDSKKFRAEVKTKLDKDTDNYASCRLNFSQQISNMETKVSISEAHHQENKAILMKLEASIDALHRRLDEVLKGK